MNYLQRLIILVGIVSIVFMILVPPCTEYHASFSTATGFGVGKFKSFFGYQLIFIQPAAKANRLLEYELKGTVQNIGYEIDHTRLGFQIFGVLVATVGLCMFLVREKLLITANKIMNKG